LPWLMRHLVTIACQPVSDGRRVCGDELGAHCGEEHPAGAHWLDIACAVGKGYLSFAPCCTACDSV